MIGLPQDTILDQPGEYLTRLIQGNKLDVLTLGKGKIHSIVYNLKEWSGDLKKYNIVKSQKQLKGFTKIYCFPQPMNISLCRFVQPTISANPAQVYLIMHGNLQLN